MAGESSVVVTGMGAVSVFGAGVERLEAGLRAGEPRFRPARRFDATGFSAGLAAEVPETVTLPDAPTRSSGLALLAVDEALARAGLAPAAIREQRVAVILGTSASGIGEVERHRRRQVLDGSDAEIPRLRAASLGSLPDVVIHRLGVRGPRLAVSTACSSSAAAVGYAADLVARGRVDLALAGGAEEISEIVFAGFDSLLALDPHGCRPFDAARRGLVLGEGAAIVVLERADRAGARGATPLARILGYGLTCDCGHITAPEAGGREAARSMAVALADAGLAPPAIDHVDAHATATPVGDPAETRGLRAVFGEPGPTVSAMKSMLGHTLGAAGAFGIVASVLQIRSGSRFRTAGLADVDAACEANHVAEPGSAPPPRTVLSNSFSFGGNNVSVLVGEAPRG